MEKKFIFTLSLIFTGALLCGCDFFTKTLEIDRLNFVRFDVGQAPFAAPPSARAYNGELISLPSVGGEFDGYFFEGWRKGSLVGELAGTVGDAFSVEGDATLFASFKSYLHKDEGDRIINGIVCVFVLPGVFMMGSLPDEEERSADETRHKVRISAGFWISKYPITNRQFRRSIEGQEDYPVTEVSWFEARDFAHSKGGRLLSEAEWEYAAKDGHLGDSVNFIYTLFSGSDNLNEVGWYAGNSQGRKQRVGLKAANKLGLYDMSGNVFEWVYDWYVDSLPGSPTQETTDPRISADNELARPWNGRIARGGGFISPSRTCRIGDRSHADPNVSASNANGFRIAFNERDFPR